MAKSDMSSRAIPIIPGNPYNRAQYFPRTDPTSMAPQRKCPSCGFPEHGSLACGYRNAATLGLVAMVEFEKRSNKYGNVQTWSELCQRTFASKAEAVRGEELAMLEKAGEIRDLEYQPQYTLTNEGVKPKVRYIGDFSYRIPNGLTQFRQIVEDVKGIDTPASRVKRAWLFQKYGIEVKLLRKGDDHA